jgi:hypothetical protein
MNYGEIKTAVKEYSHRNDLDAQIPEFIQRAAEQIGRRFGIMPSVLVNDADTNSTLDQHPQLYLYAALREMAIFTADLDATQHYDGLWNKECSEMNINYHGVDWDACNPPVICPGTDTCPQSSD